MLSLSKHGAGFFSILLEDFAAPAHHVAATRSMRQGT